MKPLILIIPPHGLSDKLDLSVEELKQYLDQAYEAGYEDGRAAERANHTITPSYPSTPCQPNITWDWNKVTCTPAVLYNDSVYLNATSWTPNDVK